VYFFLFWPWSFSPFLFFSFFFWSWENTKQHTFGQVTAELKGTDKLPLFTPLTQKGAVNVQLDSFLTSVLDGGQRSTLSPVALLLRKLIMYTKQMRPDDPKSRFVRCWWCSKSLSQPDLASTLVTTLTELSRRYL
jgi:hypothetical protein